MNSKVQIVLESVDSYLLMKEESGEDLARGVLGAALTVMVTADSEQEAVALASFFAEEAHRHEFLSPLVAEAYGYYNNTPHGRKVLEAILDLRNCVLAA